MGNFRVVLDFETVFSNDFTLKGPRRLPMWQYLRDPRFRVLGCAVKLPGVSPSWLGEEEWRGFLSGLPWGHVEAVCHNAAFDGGILWQELGVQPKRWLDTMLLARYRIAQGEIPPESLTSLGELAPLVGMRKGDISGPDLAGYSEQDVIITAALLDRFLPGVPEDELRSMDMHVRMNARPLLDLDRPLAAEVAAKDRALENLFPLVRKTEWFSQRLLDLGVQIPRKQTAKGNWTLSLAQGDATRKELLDHPDPAVRLLMEARVAAFSTNARTRAQRYLDVGAPLPVPILYFGAHTGRSAGFDSMNPQNLPRNGPLRSCIRAPQGSTLVVVDAGQIEVRVLAWLAGETHVLENFRAGVCPYCAFGERMFGHPVANPSPERTQAKPAVLALGFGQGEPGYQAYCRTTVGLEVSQEEASRTVRLYRGSHPATVHYWRVLERHIRQYGERRLPSGRILRYPGLRVEDGQLQWSRPAIFAKSQSEGGTFLWHGKLIENEVQAVARDVAFWQAALLGDQWDVVLMSHDEAVLLVREEDAEVARRHAEEAFGTPPPWAAGLPVAGTAKIMERYGK